MFETTGKSFYRRKVYDLIDGKCSHAPESTEIADEEISVLILDTSEGLETGYALSRGVLPHNLHACNHNPAHVAAITRKFRGVKTYGVPVERAAAKIKRVGWAHLDFCSNISGPLLTTINRTCAALRSQSGEDPPSVIINILAGRESPAVTAALRVDAFRNRDADCEEEAGYPHKHTWRAYALLAATGLWGLAPEGWTYRNESGQEMLTISLSLRDKRSYQQPYRRHGNRKRPADDPYMVGYERSVDNRFHRDVIHQRRYDAAVAGVRRLLMSTHERIAV
jgi:hypothetical protein